MLKVQVRDIHYKMGVKENPFKCAVSLAINDLGNDLDVCVTEKTVFINHKNTKSEIAVPLPDHVRVVVHEFDCGLLPDEIEFELPISIENGIPVIDQENYKTYVQNLKNERESLINE